jgi:AcrR family transcriptional regulator
MDKAQAIDRILEQAIRAFAEWGFEGASLRQIAAQAGVPLSTIHAYFGSKQSLFLSAGRLVWTEIAAERDAEIERARTANPRGPVTLEDIVGAMARPIMRRATSADPNVRNRLYFVRNRFNEQFAVSADALEMVDRAVLRWLDVFVEAMPRLSREDIIWAFSYCGGVMYSMLVMDQRYASMLGDDRERPADELLRDVVTFCSAGVRALADQREADARALPAA